MSVKNNPYALYKLLPGDNCGRCVLPSCMAFAAAVIRGDKRAAECPALAPEVLARLEAELQPRRGLDQEQEEAAAELQAQVAALDYPQTAARVGGRLQGERLAIPCLGKDFFLEPDGRMASQCHVNPWIQLPLLRYLLVCQGKEATGEWLPFAGLPGGQAGAALFAKRCEEPLRQLADAYSADFFALLEMFGAVESPASSEENREMIFYPLPMVPFRLAYQPPEEGLASALRITFDRCAEQNANPEMLHFLGTGMAAMVEKILKRQSAC
ncbi:DUF3786 domain-containing protein [Desulfurivibrio alkaliphilus]|uniref:Fe-S cluster domain protein n=1 Tax=Desulfurivibrio alkaliphilus (strain DSM 19089 / UNIQEM U267 / AHT2) TaxID=589865 RepID=D6Z538_DESAT|nr:DUF3786 domain-containing protein [Desulfurivibrio alkaliphilus]ADH86663.1 Fe-S cluster domain protein [Desulfurivibrio alkaliphilus AHT 2]